MFLSIIFVVYKLEDTHKNLKQQTEIGAKQKNY